MSLSRNKVDDMVLALLSLTMHKDGPATRAWKEHDWETLDRLHSQGLIYDPKSKSRSVVLSEEGVRKSQKLFAEYFGQDK